MKTVYRKKYPVRSMLGDGSDDKTSEVIILEVIIRTRRKTSKKNFRDRRATLCAENPAAGNGGRGDGQA